MAAPASAVTIRRAAEILGEDEKLLWGLADDFTPAGMEYLRELLAEHKRNRTSLRS